MPHFPPQRVLSRAPRVWFAEPTPVVVRTSDGCRKAKLQLISITGGLLYVPQPVDWGSQVKVMFLTHTGSVLGAAEMLRPASWSLQAFKFVKLYDDDASRLQAAIQSAQQQNRIYQMERFRAW